MVKNWKRNNRTSRLSIAGKRTAKKNEIPMVWEDMDMDYGMDMGGK